MIDDEIAARLCLLTMPGMGPARLSWLTADGSSVSALGAIRRGSVPTGLGEAPAGVNSHMVEAWQQHAGRTSGAELLERHRRAGIEILAPGDDAWPYGNDPEPPALLFVRGNVEMLAHRPLVGIVGTRRCSSVGRRVARQMGADLASAGVGVVSGLALGIDGAAHMGALEAGEDDKALVVGVVATGLDTVYPKKHARLWDEVAERGVLVSESPLGTTAQRWRFPARNRLLAGITNLVVVVESHEKGGALSTVEEAVARSVDVLSVPGSVLSAASNGTNALLLDGCVPALSARDVLEYLGVVVNSATGQQMVQGQLSLGGRHHLAGRTDLERRILVEIGAGGLHLDALFGLTKSSLAELVEAVQRLEADNLVDLDGSTVTIGESFR